jgi:hypothetical protein
MLLEQMPTETVPQQHAYPAMLATTIQDVQYLEEKPSHKHALNAMIYPYPIPDTLCQQDMYLLQTYALEHVLLAFTKRYPPYVARA